MEAVEFGLLALVAIYRMTVGAIKFSFRVGKFVLKGGKALVAVLAANAAKRRSADLPGPVVRTIGEVEAVQGTSGSVASSGKSWEVADRIHHVEFGRGWSMTLKVYFTRGEVVRTLRCNDSKLCKELAYTYLRTNFELDKVSLAHHSLEAILRDCEVVGPQKVADLMRNLGDPQPEALPLVQAVQVAVAPAPAELAVSFQAEIAPAQAPVASVASPARSEGGKRVQGRVVQAAKKPNTNGKGDTFEVSLDVGGGETEVLRGWHLSDLFNEQGINVGDTVAIKSLGRVPTEVKDRESGAIVKTVKNQFEVARI